MGTHHSEMGLRRDDTYASIYVIDGVFQWPLSYIWTKCVFT